MAKYFLGFSVFFFSFHRKKRCFSRRILHFRVLFTFGKMRYVYFNKTLTYNCLSQTKIIITFAKKYIEKFLTTGFTIVIMLV